MPKYVIYKGQVMSYEMYLMCKNSGHWYGRSRLSDA